MFWKNLVNVANKAEARVKIHKSTHFNQKCHKQK